MRIFPDKCRELGLPEPKKHTTQVNYLIECLLSGVVIDTHTCRYIGIGNLHSSTQAIEKRGLVFERSYSRRLCHFSNTVPEKQVLVIYATDYQRQKYLESKKPAKA